jgi:TIR domain-containing protein
LPELDPLLPELFRAVQICAILSQSLELPNYLLRVINLDYLALPASQGLQLADIFLSYARADADQARKFVTSFQAHDWSTWWDIRSLTAGDLVDAEIEHAINKSRCVVVLWSKNSTNSHYVKAEASLAAERNILIPVRIDQAAIPFEFRAYQTLDLSTWSGSGNNPRFLELIETIRNQLGFSKDSAESRAWAAKLIKTTNSICEFEVALDNDTHRIVFNHSPYMKIEVDGKYVESLLVDPKVGLSRKYSFKIADGQFSFPALFSYSTRPWGGYLHMILTVDGKVLHS